MANLLLWAVAEKWFYPHLLPTEWGFAFWRRVFSPRSVAWEALGNSVLVAICTVLASLALAIPAWGIGYSSLVCTGSAGIACARGYSVVFSDSTSVSQSNGVREYRSPILSVGTERHAVWRGAGAYGAWIGVYSVACSARLLLSAARWNRPLAPLGPARGVRL
ncbi:MAG: hypothetical protein ACR5LF_06395 [Symbiopectobacterium sp.]